MRNEPSGRDWDYGPNDPIWPHGPFMLLILEDSWYQIHTSFAFEVDDERAFKILQTLGAWWLV